MSDLSSHIEKTPIIIASNNKGKLTEFQAALEHIQHQFLPQEEYSVPEAEETGLTFVENALIKARNACIHSNLPAIADDSGLVVPAINDEPGIYSARYAGDNKSFPHNIEKLLNELDETPAEERYAYFICVLAYLRHPDDPIPMIFQGIWEGSIVFEPTGNNGFGYDPIFYVPEHQCTAAQLDLDTKNIISHRAQALNNFKNFLIQSER
jgi:XTP/dITP diphosphohydrolase